MSDQLLSVIDALVDPFEDEHGDWDDVLRRADISGGGSADLRLPVESRTPWWHRRRPLVVVLTAIALLVLLFATPAFGLRSLVLDLIGRTDVEFASSKSAPTVVKRDFFELRLGAPRGMNPQAISSEARQVKLGGSKGRVVYIAPTRKGGICYLIDGVGGGCRTSRSPLELDGTSYSQSRGEQPYATRVAGTVQEPDATTLTLEFEDGAHRDLPFVYVSRPIDTGFFVYPVPAVEREPGHRPKTVVLRDSDGKTLASRSFDYTPHELPVGPSKPQTLPTSQPVAPSVPRQQGSVNGVHLVVGSNGIVAFDARQIDPARGKLLSGRPVTYACFQVSALGSGGAPGLGIYGAFAPTVTLRFNGLPTPIDGCEIRGSYGHRWPDRLGSHSAIEIPFTQRARGYFEDRAAARDLANLVRSRAAKQIRNEQGAALATSLRTAFGTAITRLDAKTAWPPEGRIGYWISPNGVVFSRVSTTGRVYQVEIKDGRIIRENVEPLAMVF